MNCGKLRWIPILEVPRNSGRSIIPEILLAASSRRLRNGLSRRSLETFSKPTLYTSHMLRRGHDLKDWIFHYSNCIISTKTEFNQCPINVQSIFSQCSANVQPKFNQCPINVKNIFNQCSNNLRLSQAIFKQSQNLVQNLSNQCSINKTHSFEVQFTYIDFTREWHLRVNGIYAWINNIYFY